MTPSKISITRWRFSDQGKRQETEEISTYSSPVLSDNSFLCIEKDLVHNLLVVVRRHGVQWKVPTWKDRVACILKRKSPFACYVDYLLKRWKEIGIRVSQRNRQLAEEIPYRRISRTRIEIFQDFPLGSQPLDSQNSTPKDVEDEATLVAQVLDKYAKIDN